MSTTVVQLFLCKPRASTANWDYVVTGVACLAKDSNRRSYFIQVFDMDQSKLAFEQEVYREFDFKMSKKDVGIFETDSTVAALMFADVREATDFKRAIDLRLSKLQKRVSAVPSGL